MSNDSADAMGGGPKLTEDLEETGRDLDDYGLCLIAGRLGADRLQTVRERVYQLADADTTAGRGYRLDTDLTNQRIWSLLDKGDEFVDLVLDEVALNLTRHLIGRAFLLSNVTANITQPGGGEMASHCDQGYMPTPYPPIPVAANSMWLLDTFTDANGGTRYVPLSHRLDHGPGEHEGPMPDTVALEAPAGTLAVMDGRLWHRTGNNRTSAERRAAIFAYYTRPFIRQQENWFLSLSATTMARARTDPALRRLVGVDSWRGLGLVDGQERAPD